MSAGPQATPPRLVPRVLRAVLGATFFIRFGFGLTLAVFATYVTGVASASPAEVASAVGVVGLVTGAASFGEFSTVLASGMSADRYGRFRVLTIGMIVATLTLLLASFTRAVGPLIVIEFAFGVASGAILAASLAVVADQSGQDERGYEMGRFDAVNLLGWILGFAVGIGTLGLLGTPSMGQLAWVLRVGAIVVALGLVYVMIYRRGYQEAGTREAFQWGRLRAAAFREDVLLVTVPWLVIYLLIGALLVFIGTASAGVGVSRVVIAVVIGVAGGLLLLTQPYFGRLADRYGRRRLMLVGTIGFLGILGSAALVTAYPSQTWLLGLLGAFVLPALAYGPAALAALTDLSKSLSRATTMAIYTLSISLGMFLGILATSQLYAYLGKGGLYVFYGVVAAALIGLAIARARYGRQRSFVR